MAALSAGRATAAACGQVVAGRRWPPGSPSQPWPRVRAPSQSKQARLCSWSAWQWQKTSWGFKQQNWLPALLPDPSRPSRCAAAPSRLHVQPTCSPPWGDCMLRVVAVHQSPCQMVSEQKHAGAGPGACPGAHRVPKCACLPPGLWLQPVDSYPQSHPLAALRLCPLAAPAHPLASQPRLITLQPHCVPLPLQGSRCIRPVPAMTQVTSADRTSGQDRPHLPASDPFPLHTAACKSPNATVAGRTVKHLLAAGHNASEADSQGRQPLHHAALNTSPGAAVAAIKQLLTAGADPNARDSTQLQIAPLHLAALAAGVDRGAEAVKALLSAGADVAAADTDQWQALHEATRASAGAAVSALLQAGADPNATTREGACLCPH